MLVVANGVYIVHTVLKGLYGVPEVVCGTGVVSDMGGACFAVFSSGGAVFSRVACGGITVFTVMGTHGRLSGKLTGRVRSIEMGGGLCLTVVGVVVAGAEISKTGSTGCVVVFLVFGGVSCKSTVGRVEGVDLESRSKFFNV